MTYKAAGVDKQAAASVKEIIHKFARSTYTSSVVGKSGFFAGLYRLAGYRDPVLASSTDSVGTKLKLAVAMESYESLGADLVNLNVNDIYVAGAKPIFFLDYIAMEKLEPKAIEGLVKGMSQACKAAGCVLIGGETATMPDTYRKGDFDFVGFVVGAAERDELIDGSTVKPGDALIGIPSTGLHTNGFSLARRALGTDANPAILRRSYPELGRTLAEALLAPHRCYTPLLDPVLQKIKAMSHITGGALVGNTPRALPKGVTAIIRRGTWDELPIFGLIQRSGNIETAEMFNVFNMGIGMVVVVAAEDVAAVCRAASDATVIGEIVKQRDDQRVIIEGL